MRGTHVTKSINAIRIPRAQDHNPTTLST